MDESFMFLTQNRIHMSARLDEESLNISRKMKNKLFCPECGRESPTTGDWVLHVHKFPNKSWLAYRCPACETIITRRPLPG
jgi:predicted RNA-binding Zn-ribbon protein involved in translation (DUF1610 family)